MTRLFILLMVYQMKHFLADYPLQTRWMLGKFDPSWAFIRPLAAHAGVHGALTVAIALWSSHNALLSLELAAIDFAVHFTIDRIKASPNLLGKWNVSQRGFWITLGVDQMAHHLTHYFIIWVLVT